LSPRLRDVVGRQVAQVRTAKASPYANSLGYRHTWLKMSKPSIEALRQAFLDPLSRIQLQGARPSEALVHPRITKVT
jgi:hypothetical protein